VARILSTATGKDIQYFPITDDDLRRALKSAGATDDSIEMVIDLYQATRQGRTESVSPDVANILGRGPMTFEQYARDYAESWK